MAISDDVVAALTAAGVEVTPLKGPNAWNALFRQEDGGIQNSILILPDDSPYFLIFAPVGPPVSLENVPEKALRDLIRAGSDVKLAKLEYVELAKTGLFFATSECSIEGFTGEKLRKRMEACALLSSKISSILSLLSVSG